MKRTEAVEWLQLAALVVGLAGLGIVYGRSTAAIDSNTEDIAELSRITTDLAATSIRSESELRALARRVGLLEGQR